jgi:hypothetical protein
VIKPSEVSLQGVAHESSTTRQACYKNNLFVTTSSIVGQVVAATLDLSCQVSQKPVTRHRVHQENGHRILRDSRKSRSCTRFHGTYREIDALPSASIKKPVLGYASMKKGLSYKRFDVSSLFVKVV